MAINTERNGVLGTDTLYCHFSFKRKRGTTYGLFAVAFYFDFEGKRLLAHRTHKYDLWEDHQFVTAIQSYEFALRTIHEFQGQMKKAGIKQVMLVTDNSILAGWIENPKKNKGYEEYMYRAVKSYKAGAAKEIVLGIGLCKPRKSEKSYKYCREELVENEYINKADIGKAAINKISIGEYKTALDIINEDIAAPEIKDITEETSE